MGSVLHETAGREKGRRRGRRQLNEKQMTPKETEITAEEVERQMRKLKNSKKFEAWHLRTTWSLWQRMREKERNDSEPGKVDRFLIGQLHVIIGQKVGTS
ncbi:hypothetical protein MTP99_001832 [Tenebrio molitor]|nr:hypothetical protein MTP99_001832 [Tenebrio molitor]